MKGQATSGSYPGLLSTIVIACLLSSSGSALAEEQERPEEPEQNDALMPQAGSYEITTSSDFGDLPVTQVTTSCISAEQLAADPRKIFAEIPASQNCDMQRFEMSNGKLAMLLVCTAADGTVEMDTEGAYTPASYEMTTNITISTGDNEVKTQATVSAKRLGDC